MLAVLALGVVPGCGGATSTHPVVLVIQDSTVPDARNIVTPGVLGLELGLEGSGLGTRVVEVAALDAEREAADEDVVAAVVAPYGDPADDAIATLRDARVPIVSMSDLTEGDPSEGTPVRAVVPHVDVTAGAVRPAADCAAGDGSVWSEEFVAALAPIVRLPGRPAEVASAAADRGCEGVVWSGGAPGGVELAALLGRTAPHVRLTVAPAARTEGFADQVPLGLTPLGFCPCVDLTTSTASAAQRFLHRYQAANGLGAGPFAVEGFDAGRLLADLASASATREALADALATIDRFEGLAGTYAWDEEGDLVDPIVRMYERVGFRWLARPPGRVAPETTQA